MDTTKNCRLQSWTLYKSADCRWASTTILCVSFTNSATVGRLKQVQLCNRLIDQSADNITGLKCAKKCLILKYKYVQNPWCNGHYDSPLWSSGFGAIIWCDLGKVSLLCLQHDNLNVCVISVHVRKATHAKWICLAGLALEKSRGTITHPPHMKSRWPPRQIPSYSFLGSDFLDNL